MSITISGEERDALYDRIVLRLNGIEDVYRAVEEEDWETAQRLGREFSDLLRLVCDDLGWGEEARQPFSLATPPDVLRRAAGVIKEAAAFEREHHERRRDEAAEDVAEAQRLQEICERILDGTEASTLPRG
jgi:hypothetical protein